ncbi:hypothetical protein [Streptomyces sp. NBC_01262]|uniref:hypothetical protein n=1 Tax=Streptomyces sp. NBC_01262 TaxID=2903803 RepID=UPI002E302320|nr:hypothetical protein [Streptomyces sp. NBC_01262]
MTDPRDKEIRGVEIDTDYLYQDSVPYGRAMMAAYGVKDYSRYVTNGTPDERGRMGQNS